MIKNISIGFLALALIVQTIWIYRPGSLDSAKLDELVRFHYFEQFLVSERDQFLEQNRSIATIKDWEKRYHLVQRPNSLRFHEDEGEGIVVYDVFFANQKETLDISTILVHFNQGGRIRIFRKAE